MIEDVEVVQFGRQASQRAADAIARAKRHSPLAPVTVVVPSNVAGLSLRHLLGSGSLGLTGAANVSFLTPFGLISQLSADLALPTRALTNPVLGSAVRLALASDPGPFATVADHLSTEAALAVLFTELSNLDPEALRAVAGSGPSPAALVALVRRVGDALTDFHTEADVARAVLSRPDLAEAVHELGTIVWFQPVETTAPVLAVLHAVLRLGPSRVIVAQTGHDAIDDLTARLLPPLVVAPTDSDDAAVTDIAAPPPPTIPSADRIISVTDADEEVRAVVREVVALAEQGVPLRRIAVFHPVPDPYAAMLVQQFEAAGIPVNGPEIRRGTDSVAGRTLLGALRLPADRWRRDRVMALVAGAPVRQHTADGTAPARPSAWETLSRSAGVVSDLHDWHHRLEGYRTVLTTKLADATADDDHGARRSESLERDLVDLDQLDHFVRALADDVVAVEKASGWQAKAAAAADVLHHLLGRGVHRRWPDREQEAFERVEDALVRLATLDQLEPDPPHDVFVRALHAELDVSRGRVGQFGVGVHVAPLASAAGWDLDAVFVVGCAEGLLPGSRREDTLLPDATRELASGQLEVRAARHTVQHRDLLAALASAPAGHRVLTFPRGDLRSSREMLPSRWLLDTASTLAGVPVYATDFARLGPDVVNVVPSFTGGLRDAAAHADLAERDLAALVADPALLDPALDPDDHPVTALIAAGLRAAAARRSSSFTPWDGNLAGQPIPSTAERPLSPTRLENWAACGYRYFLAYVLGLAERDEPERVITVNPMDRGSVVHYALERFLVDVLEAGAPTPDQRWTDDQRAHLRDIATEVFTEFEERGRTGRPLLWELAKADLLALLDDFLHEDDGYRAKRRATPTHVELPFGLDDAAPVRLQLPDGRTLAFRGRADRVDRTADGRTIVLDYKTGKGKKYAKLADDRLQAGTTLQLGLYSEAAIQGLGAAETEAYYWMVDAGAGYVQHGYPWDDDIRTRFIEVLTAMAGGIEGGVFPAIPGEWDSYSGSFDNCRYCEFDSVCSRDRDKQALTMVAAPELRVRDTLIPPPPPPRPTPTPTQAEPDVVTEAGS